MEKERPSTKNGIKSGNFVADCSMLQEQKAEVTNFRLLRSLLQGPDAYRQGSIYLTKGKYVEKPPKARSLKRP